MTDIPLLPEHAENPFIAGLGPLLTLADIEREITVHPRYSPDEREQSPTYRRWCCLRLRRVFFPLSSQIIAVENLHMMVRDGYLGRNPLDGGHHRALLDAVERLEQADIALEGRHGATSTVGSSATIGVPGMGKTTTVEQAIRLLPSTLRPEVGYVVTQIPALQIQCPVEGSVKQFCRNFFKAVDKRIGWTRYSAKFGKASIPAETMLLHVQHLAHLHAIGVVVVDEIQNLMTATGKNVGALMKFYVTMTNTVGVPVLLVGTMSAAEILQHGFHAARRGDGYGSQVWNRAVDGPEWRNWLEQVWQYQWTSRRTRLTDGIAKVIYDETQGVLDLGIKLHMLVQMHVIKRSEFSDEPETITEEIIRVVAAERFNMVRPMILAMRSGRVDSLDQFRDISGFEASIDRALASLAGLTTEEYHRRKDMELAARNAPVVNDPLHMLRAAVRAQGFTAKGADGLVARAEEAVPSGDQLQIAKALIELVEAAKADAARPKRRSTPAPERQPVEDADDVRNLVAQSEPVGDAQAA